jgi:outer membrane lipoprotein-sorting protein
MSALPIAALLLQVAAPDPVKLYEQVRAKYAALKSYADTGTVTTEYRAGGPAVTETHSFSTFYRAPREFKLDFRKASGDRYVVWCEGQDFQTWWKATTVKEAYPKGKGALAFATAAFPTAGAAAQIPPLLFSQAGLHGPLADFSGAAYAGTEPVDDRKCHKLTGEVGLAYGTGTVTSVRPTTLWIDVETLMIRRVLEDLPKDKGDIGTLTTTSFTPRDNPDLKASDFSFSPP